MLMCAFVVHFIIFAGGIMGRLKKIVLLCLLAVVSFIFVSPAMAGKTRLAFSGGPDGGTFQYFSNGMSSRLSKDLTNIEVSNMASAGSVENVRRVNSGDADFGIAYSGDTYLARNGRLPKDTRQYTNVETIAYLYGAPAHLVVLANSGINQVSDLEGKRVAVGGAGSGAAAAAQRYFTAVGLWDKMDVEFIGYSKASAIGDHLIDAMWVFAGFPNSSVIQAAASNSVRVVSTVDAGKAAGFFTQYPFYSEVTIPAGTYSGVDYDIKTFQDSALWIASNQLNEQDVYNAVKDIFSLKGLSYLVKVKSTAKAMSIQGALNGIVTPVSPGAAKFWLENGLTLTEAQK
jgi:TRAP transporter TAXI family solute receptor